MTQRTSKKNTKVDTNPPLHESKNLKRPKSILVVGSEDDQRVADSVGIACVALVGMLCGPPQVNRLRTLSKRSPLCFPFAEEQVTSDDDADDVQWWPYSLASMLNADGGDSRILILPDVSVGTEDPVSQYLSSHSADELRELIREAPSLEAHLIERLSPKLPAEEMKARLHAVAEALAHRKLDQDDVTRHKFAEKIKTATKLKKGAIEKILVRASARWRAKVEQEKKKKVPTGFPIHQHLSKAPVSLQVLVPLGWRLRDDGLFREHWEAEATEPDLERVAAYPLFISELYRDIHSGTEMVRLAWFRQGQWLYHVTSRANVAAARKIVDLAAYGVPVTSGNAGALVEFLSRFEAINLEALPRAMVTRKLGWQGKKGKHGFHLGSHYVRPDGEVIEVTPLEGDSDQDHGVDTVLFLPEDAGDTQIISGFHTSGSFKEWLRAAALAMPFARVMLLFYAAFAGPLLKILGARNPCVETWAPTSTGKTISEHLSASVWGCPDERAPASIVATWNSTRVYIERRSAICDDLVLILDDTSSCARKQAQMIPDVIYDHDHGQGRGRGSPGGTRLSKTWNSVLITSGEFPATSLTQQGGTRARMLEIGGPPFGPKRKGRVFRVNRIDQGARANYGHAGLLFVQYLVEHRDRWPQWITEYREFEHHYVRAAGDDPVAGRLASQFATISFAADLVHEALDLPWKKVDVIEELWDQLILGADEADRAAAAAMEVMDWASSHERLFDGRYTDTEKPPMPRTAGRWPYHPNWEFIAFIPDVLFEVLEEFGHNPQATIATWHDRGWLLKDMDRKRFQKSVVIDHKRVRCYALRRESLVEIGAADPYGTPVADDLGTDPPPYEVHQITGGPVGVKRRPGDQPWSRKK